jgi:hypothetical protein
MPRHVRVKTPYPGVCFTERISPATRKPEKITSIRYRKKGRTIEEKAGRQFQDDMTHSRAAHIRAMRIHGDQPANSEKREASRVQQEAAASKPSLDRLWKDYKCNRPDLKGIIPDENRYHKCDLTPMDVDRLRGLCDPPALRGRNT